MEKFDIDKFVVQNVIRFALENELPKKKKQELRKEENIPASSVQKTGFDIIRSKPWRWWL